MAKVDFTTASSQHSTAQPINRKDLKAAAMKILRFQGISQYRVLFMKGRRECKTAWFYSRDRARQVLKMMQLRHGVNNCILLAD